MLQTKDSPSLIFLARVAGYGLSLIVVLNLLDTFVPSYFLDPNWELGTVATLIERMPLALIALLLVFYGETEFRSRLEKFILRFFSWSTLLVGMLFLLLIPLSISATVRLNIQNRAQIGDQYTQQVTQLEQLEAKVVSATDEQMNILADALVSQGQSLDNVNTETLKARISREVSQARKRAMAERDDAQKIQWLNLQKTAIKWSLSALVSAFLFFYIWRLTRWAR